MGRRLHLAFRMVWVALKSHHDNQCKVFQSILAASKLPKTYPLLSLGEVMSLYINCLLELCLFQC